MTKQTDIIRAMQKTAPLNPSGDFAARVMKALPRHHSRPRIAETLFRHRRLTLPADPTGNSRTAGSWAFFLVAFGYLVLAGILLGGLSTLTPSAALPQRVTVLPWVTFSFAVFFAGAGVVSHYQHPFLCRLLKVGLLFFLGFSAANGIMVQLALKAFFPAAGIVLYSVVGLAVGIFLYSRIELTARCPQ